MTRIVIMFRHPSVALMAVACAVAFAVLAHAGPGWVWALVPLGIAAQMLSEYNLHRYRMSGTEPESPASTHDQGEYC